MCIKFQKQTEDKCSAVYSGFKGIILYLGISNASLLSPQTASLGCCSMFVGGCNGTTLSCVDWLVQAVDLSRSVGT
jgi:hypothetical protein